MRVLSALARQHGLETVKYAAAPEPKSKKMGGDLLDLQLTDEIRQQQLVEATAAFQATYPDAQPYKSFKTANNKVRKFSRYGGRTTAVKASGLPRLMRS